MMKNLNTLATSGASISIKLEFHPKGFNSNLFYPLSNITFVLQNLTTNSGVIVYTDHRGSALITNIPNGTYALCESYGAKNGYYYTTDFITDSIPNAMAKPKDPPFEAIDFPDKSSLGATTVISLSPNYYKITVDGSKNDFTHRFIDSCIKEIPYNLDYYNFISENLFTEVNNGMFTEYEMGTSIQTSPATNPYPNILSNSDDLINYQQYNYYSPSLGNISMCNIIINNEVFRDWLDTSDHTSKQETGTMNLVFANTNRIFFYADIKNLSPNTTYFISLWVCALEKTPTSKPKLKIIISSTTEIELDLKPEIETSTIPVWQQVGVIFHLGNTNTISLSIKNVDKASRGTPFAMDDITLTAIQEKTLSDDLSLNLNLKVNSNFAVPDGILIYTIECKNDSFMIAYDSKIDILIPENTTFDSNSLIIDNNLQPPPKSLSQINLNVIPPQETITISYKVRINKNITTPSFISSVSSLTYKFSSKTNGIQERTQRSNVTNTNVVSFLSSLSINLSLTPLGDSSDKIPLANIPFVLRKQDGLGIVAITDNNGNAKIINIPPDNYAIAESYGINDESTSNVDFSVNSKTILELNPSDPTLDKVDFPSKITSESTTITSLSPNTVFITIDQPEFEYKVEFIDAPIREISFPLSSFLKETSTKNYLTDVYSGKFGELSSGADIQASSPINPYPYIIFDYGNTAKYQKYGYNKPTLGNISISNIIRNNNFGNKWWNISDHSRKNETSSMEIVSSTPNMNFFYTDISLLSNKFYSLSLWICILDKNPTSTPKLQAKLSPSDVANIDLTPEITLGNIPVWQELRGFFETGIETEYTLLLSNINTDPNGNNFAIDDISVKEISDVNLGSTPPLAISSTVDKVGAMDGEILTYTVTLKNTGNITAFNPKFILEIPSYSEFVANSIAINGVSLTSSNNPVNIKLNPILVGDTVVISFKSKITNLSNINSLIIYTPKLEYQFYDINQLKTETILGGRIDTQIVPNVNSIYLRLFLNANTSGTIENPLPINNVSFVLKRLTDNLGVVVSTNNSGLASITNIPEGTYALAECYGTIADKHTFSDFIIDNKVISKINQQDPPIDFVNLPPEYFGVPNAINSLTPNYIEITFTQTPSCFNCIFIDAPIIEIPWNIALPDKEIGENLLDISSDSNSGNFGFLPDNSSSGESPKINPYPSILANLRNTVFYEQYKNKPLNLGNISISNIIANKNINNNWWNIADHTTKLQTGRMEIVASKPNMPFFAGSASVNENHFYTISLWICILDKNPTSKPKLQLEISNFYINSTCNLLPIDDIYISNNILPVWQQLRGFFYVGPGDYSLFGIDFFLKNLNDDIKGNNFAIDDIIVKEYSAGTPSSPNFYLIQSVDLYSILPTGILTYKISYKNNGLTTMHNPILTISIPDNSTFVSNSLTINDIHVSPSNLSRIPLDSLFPSVSFEAYFKVEVNEDAPILSTITNSSSLAFSYYTEDGAKIDDTVSSNEVVTDVVGVTVFVNFALTSNDPSKKIYPTKNIPFVFQNLTTKVGVTTRTDENGIAEIYNIPFAKNERYCLAECYYTSDTNGPIVDFINYNTEHLSVNPKDPLFEDINFEDKITSGATAIISLSPNYIELTLDSPKAKYNCLFIDSLIKEIPFNFDYNNELGENLISDANEGIFNIFDRGTVIQTSPTTLPYPTILSNPENKVEYTKFDGDSLSLGTISISNIINNNKWWNISDYSTKDETGGMEIVASKPNMNFFYTSVTLEPNTNYFISLWVCILDKNPTSTPKFQAIVSPSNAIAIDLMPEITVDNNLPVWQELRGFFKTGTSTSHSLLFKNVNTDLNGNNFAIDNITLKPFSDKNSRSVLPFSLNMAVNLNEASSGDVLTYTLTITNNGEITANNPHLVIMQPTNTTFMNNSFTINGNIMPPIKNTIDIYLNPILAKETISLSFSLKINKDTPIRTIINCIADFQYEFKNTINQVVPASLSSNLAATTIIQKPLGASLFIDLTLIVPNVNTTTNYSTPITNVAFILERAVDNLAVIVLTNESGKAEITNIPEGTYTLTECYGTPNGNYSSIDFNNNCIEGIIVSPKNPDISAVNFPTKISSGANSIISLTPSSRIVFVSKTERNYYESFINTPILEIPYAVSNMVLSQSNLISYASSGTFGSYPPSTPSQFSPERNPFPRIISAEEPIVGYQKYQSNNSDDPDNPTPSPGNISIVNIIDNNDPYWKWWNTSDHTSKDERGCMEIVASTPNMNFFNINVKNLMLNTVYCISLWACILDKSPTFSPILQVNIFPSDAIDIYLEPKLSKSSIPVWQQVRGFFQTKDSSVIRLSIRNVNSDFDGYNFAIDDISLNSIINVKKSPPYITSYQESNLATASPGEIITYKIVSTNNSNSIALNPVLINTIPDNTTFVDNSITINENKYFSNIDLTSISLNPLMPDETVAVTFKVKVNTTIPRPNRLTCSSQFSYEYIDELDRLISASVSPNKAIVTVPAITYNSTLHINLTLKARSARDNSDSFPISNIPFILRNTTNSIGVVIFTDTNGNAKITNVPNGSYVLAECYGAAGNITSIVNFASAIQLSSLTPKDPPIDAVDFPNKASSGANLLVSLSPNYIPINIDGSKSEYYFEFVDAPIKNIPSPLVGVSENGENLISDANLGTFDIESPGSAVLSSPTTNPFPNILSTDTYSPQYQKYGKYYPTPGNISISNIINNNNFDYKWWNISDHTKRDESGSMEIISSRFETTFFNIAVNNLLPSQVYCISLWVCILDKDPLASKPKLQAFTLPLPATDILLEPVISTGIVPIWQQLRGFFQPLDSSKTDILIEDVNDNPIASNFAIDDIKLKIVVDDIKGEPFISMLIQVDKNSAVSDDILTYTITLTNNGPSTAMRPTLINIEPLGTKLDGQSIIINDRQISPFITSSNLNLNPLLPFKTMKISYAVKVLSSASDAIINTARLQFSYLNSSDKVITVIKNSDIAITSLSGQTTGSIVFATVFLNPNNNNDGSFVPIKCAPIVLQDIESKKGVVTFTNADGICKITNIPAGNYILVESYNYNCDQSSSANFDTAVVIDTPIPKDPSINDVSYQNKNSNGATKIISLTHNTIDITITEESSILNYEFIDAPITEIPAPPPAEEVDNNNILTTADDGSFGSLPKGSNSGNSPETDPYPLTPQSDIQQLSASIYSSIPTKYEYQQYGTNKPQRGFLSITNIITNNNFNNSWWNIADHTTGDETGRMLIVSAIPLEPFFKQTLAVSQNTNYRISIWICILDKNPNLPKTTILIKALSNNGTEILNYKSNPLEVQPAPIWVEISTILNSGEGSELTVLFSSIDEDIQPSNLRNAVIESTDLQGNNFAVDDISIKKLIEKSTTDKLMITNYINKSLLHFNELFYYSIIIKNNNDYPIFGVTLMNFAHPSLHLKLKSIIKNNTTICGHIQCGNLLLGNLQPNASVTIVFYAQVLAQRNYCSISKICTVKYLLEDSNSQIVSKSLDSNPIDLFIVKPPCDR